MKSMVMGHRISSVSVQNSLDFFVIMFMNDKWEKPREKSSDHSADSCL